MADVKIEKVAEGYIVTVDGIRINGTQALPDALAMAKECDIVIRGAGGDQEVAK